MNQKRVRFSEIMVLSVFVVLLLVSAGAALAYVKLPAVISDNMVLQGNKKVAIPGDPAAGSAKRIRRLLRD